MKDTVRQLRDDLFHIQNILKDCSFLTLSGEEKETILANSQNLLEKLDLLKQSSLMVGLLGGTGVGKSSLMNALAGSVISSTSHRRPHTDSVLIYRHSESPLPSSLPISGVSWQEFTHEADSIQQILLCDLPDFDSLMGEHREHVIHFLEYLDVLVWVTSPEKYGDGRFYEFLRFVPRAKQNFYFVLNKTDILFEGKPYDVGSKELEKLIARLQEYLGESGLADPPVYTLSASEALNSGNLAHWNQFPAFRQQIFQQRDIKEVQSIKAANLDSELNKLLSSFDEELASLEVLHKTIEKTVVQLESERSEWTEVVQESMALLIERELRPALISKMEDTSLLVGPGCAIGEWCKLVKNRGKIEEPVFEPPTEKISAAFKRQSDRLKNRLAGQFLRSGIPSSFINRLEDILDEKSDVEDMDEKLKNVFQISLTSSKISSHLPFRGLQYATYSLLFFLLFFALAGEGARQNLLDHPGGGSILNFLVTAFYALFSPAGLAALGSYALINLFFGYRFYARYKKLLEKRTDKLLDSLKKELAAFWEEEIVGRAINKLTKLDEEVEADVSAISKLKERQTI
ncbi:MAG: GTPase [Thermodesulfobacteriota bacterium]|nr:GTPase [Thermodesulfobacteriota bacterium]